MPDNELLRTELSGQAIGVDRDKRIIHGFIVAEAGPFRNAERGEFDSKSLKSIVQLMRSAAGGLKSHFTHGHTEGEALGTYLGRAKMPRLDTVQRIGPDGRVIEREVVRANLHLAKSAEATPQHGNLAEYVMNLTEEALEAPDTFGASLVLKADKEYRSGMLSPLWRPAALQSIDLVGMGEATRSALAADIEPSETEVEQAAEEARQLAAKANLVRLRHKLRDKGAA